MLFPEQQHKNKSLLCVRHILVRYFLTKKPPTERRGIERLETCKKLFHDRDLLTKIFYGLFFFIEITVFSCNNHLKKHHSKRSFEGNFSPHTHVKDSEDADNRKGDEEYFRQWHRIQKLKLHSRAWESKKLSTENKETEYCMRSDQDNKSYNNVEYNIFGFFEFFLVTS